MRVSLFVSGCTHRCRGCFNEEAQSFDYGEPFTREVEDEILAALQPSHIAGLTLLGGEPMEPANQRALVPFLRRFREKFGTSKTLWVYTGCVIEELSGGEGEKSENPAHPSCACPPAHPSCACPPAHPSCACPHAHPSCACPHAQQGESNGDSACAPEDRRTTDWRTEVTDEFLAMTDVMVDGPFVESLKDISLQFRGSSNQRILHLHV